MKKIWCIVLVLALLLCTAGCSVQLGGEKKPSVSSPQADPVSKEPEKPYQIGLIQYGDTPSQDAVREAFMGRLEEWGFGADRVEIDYQNAKGDGGQADTICKNFVKNGRDAILAISTLAAESAVKAVKGTDVKVVFVAASSDGLGVKDPDRPEGNVTGVTAPISATGVVDLAMRADPRLKTFGILLNPDDPDAVAAAKKVEDYCKTKGFDVVKGMGSSATAIQSSAKDLWEKVDALYTPTDAAMREVAGNLAEDARKSKTPWYTGADFLVQNGALVSKSVESAEQGRRAADMAAAIIAGKPVSEVPVYVCDAFTTSFNQTSLNALTDLQFPEKDLAAAGYYQ